MQQYSKVFLSDLFKEKYQTECVALLAILDRHNIPYGFLKETKDIWVRDFMPVKTANGKLVQFRYEPWYIMEDPKELVKLSDPKKVCEVNNIQPDKISNINLDGGNVLIYEDRAIISDRIFGENPEYEDKNKLVREIEELLEAKVIIIPSMTKVSDMTGHADGLVRWINRDTVLGDWKNALTKVCKNNNLTYIDIPYYKSYGIYVNYLEVGNLIVLPIFGVATDTEVIEKFKNIFPDRIIETINFKTVAKEGGGLLNCVTWTI